MKLIATTDIEHFSCVIYLFWYNPDTYFTNKDWMQLEYFFIYI
jgi:hypothetical protein